MGSKMDTKINRKVRCVESLLENLPVQTFPLRKILLFGSFVKNTFTERSDLDLCLIFDIGKEPTCTEKVIIEAYFDDMVGQEMDVDYVYASLAKVEGGNQVFDSIRKEGVVIWEHIGK